MTPDRLRLAATILREDGEVDFHRLCQQDKWIVWFKERSTKMCALANEMDAHAQTMMAKEALICEHSAIEVKSQKKLDEAIARAKKAEAERDDALRECEEQARLLGMGGSRELALITECERLTKLLRTPVNEVEWNNAQTKCGPHTPWYLVCTEVLARRSCRAW